MALGFATSPTGGAAHAADLPEPLSLRSTLSTGFVSGPVAGDAWNPALSFGLNLGAGYQLSGSLQATAGWALSRDLRFCDTCEDGTYDPGTGGTSSSRPVEAGDLRLGLAHGALWSAADAPLTLRGGLTASLPASRDALVCNPFYGALGASGAMAHAGDSGAQIALTGGLTRSFFAHDAPPVGNPGCSADLREYAGTETLTGTVEPDPWAGERYAAGYGNADWSTHASLSVADWHRWIARDPGGAWARLTTSASAGIAGRRTTSAEDAAVETLTGELTVDGGGADPLRWAWPLSVGAGLQANDRLRADLTLSNQVPRLLYDPAAYYRAFPSRTAITLALTGAL